MILIVCVDDDFGMSFNRRRQSSDRVATDKILHICGEKPLWVDPYSVSLFPDGTNLSVDKDFLERAASGEFCFAEAVPVEPWLDKAEKVILVRWNRKYPSDVIFPYEALKMNWKLSDTEEFKGYSHDKITIEVYQR